MTDEELKDYDSAFNNGLYEFFAKHDPKIIVDAKTMVGAYQLAIDLINSIKVELEKTGDSSQIPYWEDFQQIVRDAKTVLTNLKHDMDEHTKIHEEHRRQNNAGLN